MEWVQALMGALVGGVIASATAFATQRERHGQERDLYWTTARRELYADLVLAMSSLIHTSMGLASAVANDASDASIEGLKNKFEPAYFRFREAMYRSRLYASGRNTRSIMDVWHALQNFLAVMMDDEWKDSEEKQQAVVVAAIEYTNRAHSLINELRVGVGIEPLEDDVANQFAQAYIIPRKQL